MHRFFVSREYPVLMLTSIFQMKSHFFTSNYSGDFLAFSTKHIVITFESIVSDYLKYKISYEKYKKITILNNADRLERDI
jgi:hypothetical protein